MNYEGEYIVNISTGEVQHVDPWQVAERGMPDGFKFLHDVSKVDLLKEIRHLRQEVRA